MAQKIGIVVLVFVALWLINIFDISYPLNLTVKSIGSEMSVTGEGKVDVIPDTATIQAGISVSNLKTTQEVENKLNEVNNKIISAVSALEIKKEDIKTSSYSINPDYTIQSLNNSNTQRAYSGNATITIKVTTKDKASEVINAATNAGANNVYNNGFTINDTSKYREEARNKAIADAKSQAQKLAKQLGIRLGKITNIVESNNTGPVPMLYKDTPVGDVQQVAPYIEPGTQTVSSTVTLYFERR